MASYILLIPTVNLPDQKMVKQLTIWSGDVSIIIERGTTGRRLVP